MKRGWQIGRPRGDKNCVDSLAIRCMSMVLRNEFVPITEKLTRQSAMNSFAQIYHKFYCERCYCNISFYKILLGFETPMTNANSAQPKSPFNPTMFKRLNTPHIVWSSPISHLCCLDLFSSTLKYHFHVPRQSHYDNSCSHHCWASSEE